MRMKRFLCLLLGMMLAFSAQAEELSPGERIDRMLARYDTLGACVAVFQNGEITFTHSYGSLSLVGPEVTEETLFQVGSIAKMVGNMGLMQLLTEKGISLDAEIGGILGYPVRNPAYPDMPVTLRQLMTHTASLRDGGDYRDSLSGGGKPLRELFTQRGAYTFFEGYKPGRHRQYSNFGGGLIGSLIEKLSGQTLDDYMQAHVFGPLGVTAAYQPALLDAELLADMYRMPDHWLTKRLRDDDALVAAPDPETHYYFTAGKLIISAPDLCKLLIALCDGGICGGKRILKESTVAEMITPQNFRGSVNCESGHGLFLNIITNDQVEGRTLYGHGGKANGMLCAAYFDPTDRTGVVMLTNGCQNDSMHNGVGMLGRQVLTICYDAIVNPTHQVKDPFAVE